MARQHISLLLCTLTLLLAPVGVTGQLPTVVAGEPPPTMILRATPTTRHVLTVEPGFTLFIVFDAPIEFVAIGDDQLLAIGVRAPGGVVALKATQRTGRTNVHIYAGGVLMVFEVRISRGGRSADVVHVVNAGTGPRPATHTPTSSIPPTGSPAPALSTPISPSLLESPHSESLEAAATLPPKPTTNVGSFLSPAEIFRVQEVVQSGIHGAFQAYRTAGGIEIRYVLRNASSTPWKVAPQRVFVRADGKIIAPRARRGSAEGDGSVLGEGASESGLLVLGRDADAVELLFPLFPLSLGSDQLPLLLTVRFSELGALVEVKLR